jgi:DNA repair photolyase
MNYWDYRDELKKALPRISKLTDVLKGNKKIKEKGRKKNYHQFNLKEKEFVKQERLLDTSEIKGFLEVSLRAQSCPMPFNVDVWDALHCPFGCRYCYADYFKHSLYTSFFDNPQKLGFRNCNPDFFKKELDRVMKYRGGDQVLKDKILNAVRLEIPMRLGIRFEDFSPVEKANGIALQLLNHLAKLKYPVMINTKSDLVAEDAYLRALTDNPAKSAVHITLISSDNNFLSRIEPGAPSFENRWKALKILNKNGIRAVARIEPFMVFVNDRKDQVDEYIARMKEAGVRHITWDTYSYSANSISIENSFSEIDIDFRRMFSLSSEAQAVSSFMMGKMMEYFREHGIECSTFDPGNVPDNDDHICCSVGDWFEGGFNYGCEIMAIKYIKKRAKKGKYTSWSRFEKWVNKNGGFLSEEIKKEVKKLWNLQGDAAWYLNWSQGMEAYGSDQDGMIWTYKKEKDFREKIVKGVLEI